MFQKKNDFFEVRSEVRLDDHLMEFGIFAFVQIDLSLAYVSSEGQRKDFFGRWDMGELQRVDGNVFSLLITFCVSWICQRWLEKMKKTFLFNGDFPW